MSLFKIYTYRTFEPTEISGLQVWLDNDTLGADGSAVASWADSSGNGYNFTQSDSSLQPDVYLDGSKKTVRMNHDSFLACLSGLAMLKNTTGGTIYTVYKPEDNTNPVLVISDGLNSFDPARLGASNAANVYQGIMKPVDNASYFSAMASKAIDTGNYIIHGVSGSFSTNDIYQYLDGSLDGSNTQLGGSNSSNTNSAGIFLGATLQIPHGALVPSASIYPRAPVYASIRYAEVLIFNRVLTALEKYYVEHYLSVKHGITLA